MDVYELDAHLRKMTPHQLKIIQALYDADSQWLSRAGVARALDKRRLTPYDIECLHKLGDLEIAIVSTRPTTAPGSDFAYIYSMSDEIADLIQQWTEMRDTLEQERKPRRRKPINIIPNQGDGD